MPRRIFALCVATCVAIGLVVGAGRSEVRAESGDDGVGDRVWLDLALGVGTTRWQQSVTGGPGTSVAPAAARGFALGDLTLGLRRFWIGPGAFDLGFALSVEGERHDLALRPQSARGLATTPGKAPVVVVSGGQAQAAFAARATRGRWSANAEGGYQGLMLGVPAIELSSAGLGAVATRSVRAHGPYLGLGGRLGARRFAIAAAAELMPVGFGAAIDGAGLSLWRGQARASIEAGGWRWGPAAVSALLEGAVARTTFHRTADVGTSAPQELQVTASAARLVLGLRIAWYSRVRSPAAADVAPSAIPPPSSVRGLVRGEAGEPMAARISVPELDLVVTTDAGGAFLLTLPPGEYTLLIEAPQHLGQRKTVEARSGEQRIYNVDLQREIP